MGFGRDKILRLLYENREGLGHNELKGEGVGEKTLRMEVPRLKREGLLRIKKTKVRRGGTKNLHQLTLRGIAYVKTKLFGGNLFEKFLEFHETYPPEKDILQEIVQDTLDRLYGKGVVTVYFMPKNESLEYQEYRREKKHGKVIWKNIPDEKENEALG